MKTPTDLINQVTCNGMRELTELRAIEAIEAYHAQFTVTTSEREREIIIAVLEWMDESDIRDVYNNRTSSVYNRFLQSNAYKSIPPAPTMPSREDAKQKALEFIAKYALNYGVMDSVMAMYDYLTDQIKSNLNNSKWNY